MDENHHLVKELKGNFERLDSNKDEVLSFEEYLMVFIDTIGE